VTGSEVQAQNDRTQDRKFREASKQAKQSKATCAASRELQSAITPKHPIGLPLVLQSSNANDSTRTPQLPTNHPTTDRPPPLSTFPAHPACLSACPRRTPTNQRAVRPVFAPCRTPEGSCSAARAAGKTNSYPPILHPLPRMHHPHRPPHYTATKISLQLLAPSPTEQE
jgi:hypothetical protein